jgi:hypothetical protein
LEVVGFLGHRGGFSGCGLFVTAILIVRRRRLIICKRVTLVCSKSDPGRYGVYQWAIKVTVVQLPLVS